MGVDMHGYIEIREKNNWWSGIINLEFLPRFIYFMDRFAGIRGEVESVSYNKGLPNDMSDECKKFYESELELYGSFHGKTYVSGKKLVEVLKETEGKTDNWYKEYYALHKMVEALVFIYGIENIRGIFWFDN